MKAQSTKLGFYVYRAKDGFRWRLIHRNGNILAESGEAYRNKSTLMRVLNNLIAATATGDFELFDQTK